MGNWVTVILTAAILASVANASVLAARTQKPEQREEAAIQAVIAGMTEAFNKHDAKAWIRFATADVQVVTVRGESMTGVAEVERGLTTLFQTRNKSATVKVLTVTVRFIRPDVALAYVTSELSGVIGLEGQTLPASREFSLRVFAKDRDTWRITAFHNTAVRP